MRKPLNSAAFAVRLCSSFIWCMSLPFSLPVFARATWSRSAVISWFTSA